MTGQESKPRGAQHTLPGLPTAADVPTQSRREGGQPAERTATRVARGTLEASEPQLGDQIREEERKRSRKADRQEFFLPVTGFAWFFPEEVKIIDHPAFQRLSRVNQLGQTHLVFRGASHKRIEHVLGAVHIAQRMIAALNFNADKEHTKPLQEQRPYAPLSEEEQRFIRLGALLHDIGHLAAGHTLEDELSLIGKHDGDDRLTLIFDKNDWGAFGGKNQRKQSLQDLLNDQYKIWMPSLLLKEGLTPTDVVRILIRKKTPEQEDKFKRQQEVLEKSAEVRLDVCSNMIGNTICADLLDYLHRDWYHIGKPNFFDDRIFQYMEIRGPSGERASADDRFVIALGQSPKIRTDGVSAILTLLEWRYQLVIWNASSSHYRRALGAFKGERLWRKQVCEAGRSHRWC